MRQMYWARTYWSIGVACVLHLWWNGYGKKVFDSKMFATIESVVAGKVPNDWNCTTKWQFGLFGFPWTRTISLKFLCNRSKFWINQFNVVLCRERDEVSMKRRMGENEKFLCALAICNVRMLENKVFLFLIPMPLPLFDELLSNTLLFEWFSLCPLFGTARFAFQKLLRCM